MSEFVYVPFPRKLYDDLVRFSDGRCKPAEEAAHRLEAWIDLNFSMLAEDNGWTDDYFVDLFEERLQDFAKEYHPPALAYWETDDIEERAKRQPLVWKEVVIPSGAGVRMAYAGKQHYANVSHGRIRDGNDDFSPSEWASKVAGGTSRNAWRDLWFKLPGEVAWTPAMLLRERMRAAMLESTENGECRPENEGGDHDEA